MYTQVVQSTLTTLSLIKVESKTGYTLPASLHNPKMIATAGVCASSDPTASGAPNGYSGCAAKCLA